MSVLSVYDNIELIVFVEPLPSFIKKVRYIYEYKQLSISQQEVQRHLIPLHFGRNATNALSLYNALNNSVYTEADFEYTTLDNVIYMKAKNDLSFIIQNSLSIYEHQSTFNPNMPLGKAVDIAVNECNFFCKMAELLIMQKNYLRLLTKNLNKHKN